jgi:hypothetical protein
VSVVRHERAASASLVTSSHPLHRSSHFASMSSPFDFGAIIRGIQGGLGDLDPKAKDPKAKEEEGTPKEDDA